MSTMKFSLLVCMTFISIKNLHASPQTSVLDAFVVPFRLLRTTIQTVFLNEERSPYHQRSLRDNGKLQDVIGNNTPFPCSLNNTKSPEIPETVHRLRPGDIKVIGAIGDSLTAGFGLMSTNFVNILVENRGLSFSGGGQGTWRDHLTLPNILKVFNPELRGYSLRASLSRERASQFNVAEGGAISANTPYMSTVLVKRIKSDPRVNLKKDWKMINVFIGANDFCSEICYMNPPERVLELHKEDMVKVLRTLRDNLPRTFVNIIPPPDVGVLARAEGIPNECLPVLSFNCPCITGLVYQNLRKRFAEIIKKWQEIDIRIASYPEFNKQDFQVVAQHVFDNFSIPQMTNGLPDFSYLGGDCFHLSQKGGALVANLLWNILLQPVNKKRPTEEKLFAEFKCPSEDSPFLFTQGNSIQNINSYF